MKIRNSYQNTQNLSSENLTYILVLKYQKFQLFCHNNQFQYSDTKSLTLKKLKMIHTQTHALARCL
jgi:hypothetical protein